MDMQRIAELVKDAVDNTGDEGVSFYNGYSGRGMYGRKCIGVVGSEKGCMQVVAEVLKQAHSDPSSDLEFDTVADTLLDYDRDSMGRDIIMYWPQLDVLEVVFSYEHDGQPDEAQEWADFDPDC
jgi:hypothetical protein